MNKRSLFKPRGAAGLRVVQSSLSEVEMMLYDEISPWGVTAQNFKKELDGISASTIHLRINSPGGDVFDSLAIYNALREHPAHVVSHIDGLAASMASVVALSGDEVQMEENAFFMVHNPWALVVGNAEDLRETAAMLDKVGGSLLLAYTEKTGMTNEDIQAWMNAETWFTADEAKATGFVDVVKRKKKKNMPDEEEMMEEMTGPMMAFDLSVFTNVPAALTERPAHEPTIRDLERALRDAGLSQIAAKQYVAAGRTAALQRDVVEAEERDVTSQPVARTRLLVGV